MSQTTPPDSKADTPVRTRRELLAWRNAVFAIFFLSGLSIASWVARIPAVRDDTGLTLGGIGLVIFGMSAGSVLGLIAAPWFLARIGARRGMVSALVLVAIGIVIVGLGSTVLAAPAVIFVGMAMFGFGNGACDVMMNVEGALAERENGKTLMPLMHAFFSFGTVAGAGIGALASGLDIPVALHLIVIGALIVTAILITIRFIPIRESAGDARAGQPREPWRERMRHSIAAWSDVRLIFIGVIMLGMSFAEGSANDWLALATVDGHGYDNTTGALVFGLFVTAMTVSRVVGGPVLDRFGRVPVLRTCAALGVLGLLLFIYGTETWMLLTGVVLWGFGCALGFPVGMSAAADVDDDEAAAARVSAVAIIGYCAFLAGPPLLGFLGQHFGILNALLVLLVLMVLAGLAAPAARERTKVGAPAA